MTANSLSKQKSYNYVASVVAAYWVISISMVYLNKVRACSSAPPVCCTHPGRSIPIQSKPLLPRPFRCS